MSEVTQANEIITQLISEVFEIEQVTWGGHRERFEVLYRGRLKGDSERIHQQLLKSLEPYNLTPFFRQEGGDHLIQLVRGLPKPRPSNPWVNLVLFLLTLLSMVFTGVIYSYEGTGTESFSQLLGIIVTHLSMGIPFAASLLAILLAHEFGHYLAGRYHKTAVTLPYFLPFPLSPFGTLGAFIQLKEPPRNKRVLLDIGIAGPLAGLVVAIPVLLYGLSLSSVEHLPLFVAAKDGFQLEGNSILYLAAKYLTHGQLLPAPLSYNGMPAWLYWLRYLFTGLPTPFGGQDVILHPIAWAGWAGLLVTALNLIPVGQLDGGHLINSLAGKTARVLLPVVIIALAVLGIFWPGWWLWVFLILLLGGSRAQSLDEITALDRRRRGLAVFGLVVFILVFTPVPLREVIGPYFGP